MFIAVPALLLFALCCCLMNNGNRYIKLLFLPVLSVSFFILALGIYIVKVSFYAGTLSWEAYVYRTLIGIPVHYYVLVDLLNIGVSLYLLSMWIVGFVFVAQKNDGGVAKRVAYCAFLLLVIGYAVLNMSGTSCGLYVKLHLARSPATASTFARLAPTLDALVHLTVITLTVLPLATVFHAYREERFVYRKNVLFFFQITLLAIDVIFAFCYVVGPVWLKLNSFQNLLRYMYESTFDPFDFVLLAIVVCFMLFVVIGMIRYRFWELLLRMRGVWLRRRGAIQYNEVSGLAHSMKTSIYSIIVSLRDTSECRTVEEYREEIDYISKLADSEYRHIEELLETFRDGYNHIVWHDAIACVKDVVDRTAFPKNITVVMEIPFPSEMCRILRSAFEESLKNIFSNSIDAIGDKPDGEIHVYAERDETWLYLAIRDNGCGIERKQIRHIFDPLYSTKQPQTNWGVGLSYVKTAIENMSGLVFATSREGEFTEIQMMLPHKRGGGR